jgi:two-component system response regulator GlrR
MQSEYKGRLLIVDDDEQTCAFWKLALSEAGFIVDVAHNLDSMKEIVLRYSIDVVLLDMNLKNENGLDGIPFLVSRTPYSKVFMLTGHASIQTAVSALQDGATGYITKDTDPTVIAEMISRHLQIPTHSPTDLSTMEEFAKYGFIGKSKAFQELCHRLKQLKDVDSTILLLGESGTGKEVIARVLHKISNRATERFEAINCAAIPENLLESELFGHKRGAFTDAKADRKGIFELCSKGTLLLDEIGDMPIILQAKLLRVLQEKVVVPIGSSTTIKIDTRVIVATHRDLVEEIESGRFREDLYYRISVVPLFVPPLRHRKEDIPLLVEAFIAEFNVRFNRCINRPSEAVMKRLIAYDWPGNVRELRNAIERAVVLTQDDQLRIEDLFHHLHSSHRNSEVIAQADLSKLATPLPKGINKELFVLPLTEAKQVFEKIYLETQLSETHGNVSETSKRAGRYRADIYRLLERYDLQVDSFR